MQCSAVRCSAVWRGTRTSPWLRSVGLGTPFRPRWRSIFGGALAAAAPRAPGILGPLLQRKYRVRAPHAKTADASAPSGHLSSAFSPYSCMEAQTIDCYACCLVSKPFIFAFTLILIKLMAVHLHIDTEGIHQNPAAAQIGNFPLACRRYQHMYCKCKVRYSHPKRPATYTASHPAKSDKILFRISFKPHKKSCLSGFDLNMAVDS